jgi:hypothetical protein
METEKKHKLIVRQMIRPNGTIQMITGSMEPLPYSEFLKKLWEYFKSNGLNYTEKV